MESLELLVEGGHVPNDKESEQLAFFWDQVLPRLLEGHRHHQKCVHGGDALMIVEMGLLPSPGGKDNLSTALYFRRCDGRYKKVRGQVLEI